MFTNETTIADYDFLAYIDRLVHREGVYYPQDDDEPALEVDYRESLQISDEEF
jgi:hypothetical protein